MITAIGPLTLADALFEAEHRFLSIEDVFLEKLKAICGYVADWPFEDTKIDQYDSSFELIDARNDLVFTENQWERLRCLGFANAWICHCNGSEHMYPGPYFKQHPAQVWEKAIWPALETSK